MILWVIVWIVLGIPIILLPILAFVNYIYRPAPSWYVWVVGICLFIVVLSCVMVFSERQACTRFLEEYHKTETLMQQIYAKASDIQSAEKQIQGKVVKLNNQLVYFLRMQSKFGLFSPYQYELRKLQPLHLKFYDTSVTVVDPYI